MSTRTRGDNVSEAIILLVDDDPDYRMLVRDAIESLGRPIKVFECVDGCDGIRFLQQICSDQSSPRPDLVLLDLEMPGADGHEVLIRVRADQRLRDLPVVVMTGVDDDESERRALSNGASSYTCKVQDTQDMLRRIEAAAVYWTTVHRQLPRATSAA
ncbi:MAG: response regulator [Phycisphaerales bacterium]|nr:response regulator [Phycisphaerales bacterium]